MTVAIVTVNGQLMTAPFWSRLVSIECVDQEGITADTCRLVLNDGPEAGYLAIPDRGAFITVALGQMSAILIGRYTLDEVTVQCLPYAMEISGKSADVRKEMKANKVRHWDDKTLGDVVEEIAGEHGLTASVDQELASFQLPWLGQLDESDLHFLERLAKRQNALFSVKNGQLIMAKKGSGTTPGGTALSTYTVTPNIIVENTCRVSLADRSTYKDVVAYYQDRDGVQRKELRVEVPGAEDGVASYTVQDPMATEEEAEKVAGSKAKELQRATDRLSVTVLGDPGVAAGMPLTLAGVRPGVDGRQWIAKTVRHRFDKGGGYTTSIDAEAKV